MKPQPCFFWLSVGPEEQVGLCTELQVLLWLILPPLGLVSAEGRRCYLPCSAVPAWPAGSQTVAECRDPALGGGCAPVPAAVECGILWILWMVSADLRWVSPQGLSFWVFYSNRCGGGSLGFRDTVVDKPYQGWYAKVVRKK